MPVNFFDSLGTHWCDCKNSSGLGKLIQNQNVVILPNPVTNSQFMVQATLPVLSVEVVSIVGQTVYFRDYMARQQEVQVLMDKLPEGIYLVRVRFTEGQPVIRKIIIQ
jgi:hypothetical protein